MGPLQIDPWALIKKAMGYLVPHQEDNGLLVPYRVDHGLLGPLQLGDRLLEPRQEDHWLHSRHESIRTVRRSISLTNKYKFRLAMMNP